MLLLAVNSGSSTLKFRLYDMPSEKVVTKGSLKGLARKIVTILLELMMKKSTRKKKLLVMRKLLIFY